MQVNLFCLPFAGGSKYSFNTYMKFSPDNINIIPLEYPGRGNRFKESLMTDLPMIVNDIFNKIKNDLHTPYAFYGHSMGTIVSYLVTKKIIAAGMPQPLHLFVSGRGGPSVVNNGPPRHLLPTSEFRNKLREMGGSPEEVLADESLMSYFEPILRADFQSLENYKYEKTPRFDIPITVMTGLEEKITTDEAQAWQEETNRPITIKRFTGKHFFIFDHSSEIINLITETIHS